MKYGTNYLIIGFIATALFILFACSAGNKTMMSGKLFINTAPAMGSDEMVKFALVVPCEGACAKQKCAEAVAQSMEGVPEFADIHFDYDKMILHKAGEAKLRHDAEWLKKHEEYSIRIEGNCDERGTDDFNMALGNKRAMSAKKYLMNLGIPEERIFTVSYGKERPFDPGHNEEAWAKNRRDHFVLIRTK